MEKVRHMVWPTLGSRTIEEQNRTETYLLTYQNGIFVVQLLTASFAAR